MSDLTTVLQIADLILIHDALVTDNHKRTERSTRRVATAQTCPCRSLQQLLWRKDKTEFCANDWQIRYEPLTVRCMLCLTQCTTGNWTENDCHKDVCNITSESKTLQRRMNKTTLKSPSFGIQKLTRSSAGWAQN